MMVRKLPPAALERCEGGEKNFPPDPQPLNLSISATFISLRNLGLCGATMALHVKKCSNRRDTPQMAISRRTSFHSESTSSVSRHLTHSALDSALDCTVKQIDIGFNDVSKRKLISSSNSTPTRLSVLVSHHSSSISNANEKVQHFRCRKILVAT
jgi:hypothetical protein